MLAIDMLVRASRILRGMRWIRILAASIYFPGLSYRRSSLDSFSYEAVRLCYNILRDALPKPEKKHCRFIAVDETKAKLGKEQAHIYNMLINIKTGKRNKN